MSLTDKWVWSEFKHWRITDNTFDSSIDWCEPNWPITPYIGEFFNCITVMPAIIQFTLLFINMLKFRNIIDTRYYAMLFIFLLSSISGTTAHATLLYTVGIIDEFVLLNVAIITIFVLITTFKIQTDKIHDIVEVADVEQNENDNQNEDDDKQNEMNVRENNRNKHKIKNKQNKNNNMQTDKIDFKWYFLMISSSCI
eukprot:211629_1